MAKRETLLLSRYQSIETYKDWNGRIFIACSSGSSRMFDDRKELLRFLKVAKGLPMRATLDSWLDGLEAADAKRKGATVEPVGDAKVDGSFDPLAHQLDESDPNYATRVII